MDVNSRIGDITSAVASYYSEKVRQHGTSHRGVDWNSRESQEVRFQQLLRVLGNSKQFSILDYGCGYGALARFLADSGFAAAYVGFDVSEAMIQSAREYARGLDAAFTSDIEQVAQADYVVASGVFNVRLGTSEADWIKYVLNSIDTLNRLAKCGFAFNVLTRHSDADRMRADLYYADPLVLFEHCRVNYSRHVALLHDYGLYEFTISVRK